jgi:hypothetical protein
MFTNQDEYECFLFNFCERCTKAESCQTKTDIKVSRLLNSEGLFPSDSLLEFDGFSKYVCKNFNCYDENIMKNYGRLIRSCS